MSFRISVIICTYNPRREIFSKCLDTISKAVSHSPVDEIIIVDNNSHKPVSEEDYVVSFAKKHPATQIVTETKQGLTPARLKGIMSSSGEILIFVDDDNFVHPDFFEKGASIALSYPYIGSWSGQVKLVFERQPEEWTRKYWGMLVYREFENDLWSNLPHLPATMPCGAGLFVRRNVADYYVSIHNHGKRDIQLDRTANSLFSGGDNDLAACACDLGLGVGLFHELILDHYIPINRTSKDYLLKLAEGIAASAIVFRTFRNEIPHRPTIKNRLANAFRLMLKDNVSRQFYRAVLKGENKGREIFFNQIKRNEFDKRKD